MDRQRFKLLLKIPKKIHISFLVQSWNEQIDSMCEQIDNRPKEYIKNKLVNKSTQQVAPMRIVNLTQPVLMCATPCLHTSARRSGSLLEMVQAAAVDTELAVNCA